MTRSFSLVAISCLVATACSSAQDAGSRPSDDDSQFTEAEGVPAPQVSVREARVLGTVDVGRMATTAAAAPQHDPQLIDALREELEELTQRPVAAPSQPPSAPATVLPSKVAPTSRAVYGFGGLAVTDSDTATKGNGVTPPDQALCAGNGYVVEAVNDVLAIYDILGEPVMAPVALESFFQFPADDKTHGSFSSDPKCLFDPISGRFFATILRITFAADANGKEHDAGSKLDIAVSKTGDPRGAWSVFEIDADDDGTGGSPNHPHCPCLGDQPLIGADEHGFYLSTNEFGDDRKFPGYNGAQVYAVGKKALLDGTKPAVVQFSNLVLADGIAASVQPATSPTGKGDPAANGTEYFLSSLDPDVTVDNRIAVWALSNTKSLDSDKPDLHLEHAVLASETYGAPGVVTQKAGATPLRDCLAAGTCAAYPNVKVDNTMCQLDGGDDRMMQTVYANGRLWAALNSVVQVNGQAHVGAAWFSVEAKRMKSGHLGGRVAQQGYVALANNDVLYPSIALTEDGVGALAFSVAGADYWPSAAFARFDARKGAGDVQIVGAGAGPLDDFSGYATRAGRRQGPARFGDYSAAMVDGTTVWMANEWVPSACDKLPCDGRDTRTNWGTYVSRIDLEDTIDP